MRQRVVLMRLLPIVLSLLLAVAARGDGGGAVTLPLADYHDLIERIERAEEAQQAPVEPPVAVLTSQSTAVTVAESVAEVVSTFTVERRGRPASPVVLPLSGLAESATVEPQRGAALHRRGDDLVLVAPEPGSYTVTVRGRAPLADGDGSGRPDPGVRRLALAGPRAPVATLDLDLPAELDWQLDEAILVAEEVEGERRRLRLAPVRQSGRIDRPFLELRRRLSGAEEDRVRARAVVVTVARPGDAAVERRDVVLYEVERGELGRFAVDLPAGLEVERAATDEGDALPRLEAGWLVVERQRRLSGTGHLALTFRPLALDGHREVPLATVVPKVSVRARYLVLVTDHAAQVEALPAAGWLRVDHEDLPRPLRREVAALGPSAVWRWAAAEAAAEARLRSALLAPVDFLGAIVWRRTTTTLLTVDGSLVHREYLVVRHPGDAFELSLPTGATLWSARVDGQAVRPVERGAALAVPLAFRAAGEAHLELVAVEERSIDRGASRLGIELTRLAVPVLEHQWRLLLPEQHRYRLASSDLSPAPTYEASTAVAMPQIRLIDGLSGDCGITGTVSHEEDRLPGVTLLARPSAGGVLQAVSNAEGRFWFRSLAPDTYRVKAQLDGFVSVESTVAVPPGKTAELDLTLPLAMVEETIVVTSQAPSAALRSSAAVDDELDRRQMQQAAERELLSLEQGLVGGVKPLRVEIPESGKLLLLSGALPPERVGVELEVKAKR